MLAAMAMVARRLVLSKPVVAEVAHLLLAETQPLRLPVMEAQVFPLPFLDQAFLMAEAEVDRVVKLMLVLEEPEVAEPDHLIIVREAERQTQEVVAARLTMLERQRLAQVAAALSFSVSTPHQSLKLYPGLHIPKPPAARKPS